MSNEVVKEKNVNYRFKENKTLEEIFNYVTSTYSSHYVSDESEIQSLDVWIAGGAFDTSCRDTALKYLMRYGKKEGKNRKDLYKAVHYILYMLYDLDRKLEKEKSKKVDV